jgi:hypothetical protein
VSGTDRARGIGITLKIFLATALVVVVLLAVTIVASSALARQNALRNVDRRLQNTAEVTQRFIEAENDKLASGASAATQNPNFLAAVLLGGSNSLDQAVNYQEILDADFTLITDKAGVMQARTDRPGAFGDSLGGSPLVGGALEGSQVTGYVNQADERLYLAVATPLKDLASNVVQAVLLAAHQVNDSLVNEVKRGTGSDIVFYVFGENDQPRIVASSVPASPALDSAVASAAAAGAGSGEMRRVAGGLQPPADQPGRGPADGRLHRAPLAGRGAGRLPPAPGHPPGHRRGGDPAGADRGVPGGAGHRGAGARAGLGDQPRRSATWWRS